MLKNRFKRLRESFGVRTTKFNQRISENQLMVRPFLASLLFFFSLGIFNTLSNRGGDFLKVFILFYALCLILFFLYNIFTFLKLSTNSMRLGLEKFPMIFTMNSFLGFISQLLLINLALSIFIRALSNLPNYGFLSCEIRCSLSRFYFDNQIYTQISNLTWWASILVISSFVVGSYLCWLKKAR